MSAAHGARFERLFDDVWNQLHRLQTHWTIYLCLYGTRSSVQLVRSTALVTFGALQELLTLAIFLETHRLLDNGSTSGQRTASIESLIQDLPPSSAALRRGLKRELKAVRAGCRQLTEWRHRHIAHRDAATVLGERCHRTLKCGH